MKQRQFTMIAAIAVLAFGASGALFAQGVLFVKNNRVGIGTDAPAQPLHVFDDANSLTYLLVKNPAVGTSAAAVVRTAADVAAMNFQSHSTGRAVGRFGSSLGGWNEFLAIAGNGLKIGTQGPKPFILGTNSANRLTIASNGFIGLNNVSSPAFPIEHSSGAHLTAGGVWANASSRELKEGIRELSDDEARQALGELTPVQFSYKSEPGEQYVGFIAEDVPDLVATSDRASLSSMDVVALLTKVVQGQERTIAELSRRIEELER